MKTVTKMKLDYQYTEDGRYQRIEIPYTKNIFEEEDKMRIVSEYYQGHESAQEVVTRYSLSSKQVLFSWMDKYLCEESDDNFYS